MHYANKRIAVLGAGASGEAAARLLEEEHAMVTVLDGAKKQQLRAQIENFERLGIPLIAAPESGHVPLEFDMAVLSPGIDPSVPLVRRFIEKRIEMIGELELAYEMCACPVIAITGTNGKTTTTELVAAMLNGCGVRTVAAGNIGPAFTAVVRKSDQLDVMTLEVSSFQLEQIRTFRPHVSVWLNFTPDHLDRYRSLEEYRAAKLRIFENQTADDVAVVNLREDLPPIAARKTTFSAFMQGGDFEFRDGAILHHGEAVLRIEETNLRGKHNAENLMAALGVGLAHGLAFEQMAPPLRGYHPLPHRCELIRTLDGVDYINDSKATNPDALEAVLASEQRPVVLIAGGKDKGFGFDELAGLVAMKCRCAILIGEMKEQIARSWTAPCMSAETLIDAVNKARAAAQPGDVVLFSPGTSSFDMFKNYADRGNQFRGAVQNLEP